VSELLQAADNNATKSSKLLYEISQKCEVSQTKDGVLMCELNEGSTGVEWSVSP